MPDDLAVTGRKRSREESSSERASRGLDVLSKRGRGEVGETVVFQCTICGKAFSRSGNLTTHMRTHTGARPYPCPTCGVAFSQSGTLTAHMRTHTGARPYPCNTC